MKARRYFIIITWFPYDEHMGNKTTVMNVEESFLETALRTLPLYDIASLKIEENNEVNE